MYTSYIGKKFLKIFNERNAKAYNAETFFNEILFPLFFNDEKHFMNVANSSFFQKVPDNELKNGKTKPLIQLERFRKQIKNEPPSLTTLVGAAAVGVDGTTSGQVSNIKPNLDIEEMYASWIGAGLGIGMGGNFSILIDNEEVLWQLFEGWKYYRLYLTQTLVIKGNQIETWNGYWLCHTFGKNYNVSKPLEMFQIEFIPCREEKNKKKGFVEYPSQKWIKIIFALCRKFPNQVITAYSYSFSRTNTTLGFINLYLPEVKRYIELQDKIIPPPESETITGEQLEEIYNTYLTYKNACKYGTIGLRAIEPSELREYMPKPFGKEKEYKFVDIESYKYYQIFKNWIIAMISSKTELNNVASELAGALLEFEKKIKPVSRAKTAESHLIEELRTASSLVKFIDKLGEIMEKSPESIEIFKKVKDIVLMIPADLFPLFITLIRFEYNYLKNKN